jgi:hypothetical protein
MNCPKNTLFPALNMRSERPNAAVVFPLPFPVYTCTYPFSSIYSSPRLIIAAVVAPKRQRARRAMSIYTDAIYENHKKTLSGFQI